MHASEPPGSTPKDAIEPPPINIKLAWTCRYDAGARCTLPTDIILESSDGKHFGCHTTMLQHYVGFSGMSRPCEEMFEILKMEHSSETLLLIIKFMHHTEKQPDIITLYFDEFETLAHAVELHNVEPARQLCKMRMINELPRHAVSVLAFAVKYHMGDLLSKAAIFTLEESLSTMEAALGTNTEALYNWIRYREHWLKLQKLVWTDSQDETNLECTCEWTRVTRRWYLFHHAVLRELGSDLSALPKLPRIAEAHKRKLQGCGDCTLKADTWMLRTKVGSYTPFFRNLGVYSEYPVQRALTI